MFGLQDRAALARTIDGVRSRPLARVLFIAVYGLGAAVGVPATPLTLAGGALFGIRAGVLLNWLGEMLAAVIAFALARAVRTPPPLPTLPDKTVWSSRAFLTLLRLRLIPVAPFALLNAGAALRGVSWSEYLGATAIGIVPITVIYTISASELVAGVAGSGTRALTAALISGAVLILVSFLPAALRRMRRARSY